MGMEIKPQAVVIPKETDHLEQGEIRSDLSQDAGVLWVHDHRERQAGQGGSDPQLRDQRWRRRWRRTPTCSRPLKLHYLRWVLFDNDTRFMYQGIFDTDFDKYTEDAVVLFGQAGVNTVFENLEGFPMDWKTNPDAFIKFVRDHQCPSFLEYGEYPYVTRRRDQEGPEDQGTPCPRCSIRCSRWRRREVGRQ